MHRERLPLTLFGELREMVQISRNQSLSKNALLCHINTYKYQCKLFFFYLLSYGLGLAKV